MIYCLCGSIIFMVIIMIGTLSEIGKYIDENFDEDRNEIFTTQHLRGMYVEGITDEIFTNIYNSVIGSAVGGKTSADFTIMCIRNQYNNCDNYDGYQRWWIRQIKKTGGEVIPKNNIQSEQIKRRVIQKIQHVFPDSNITKGYENCCDTYNITW